MSSERTASIKRYTTETKIDLFLDIDGEGRYDVDTGCGFLNHMLELFARHGNFNLNVKCRGDIDVDYHHTTEDTGIALGEAFAKALGDKRGILRYGDIILPMDETLIMVAVDLGGRAYLDFSEVFIPAQKVGDFDTELVKEFMLAFTRTLGANIHIRQLAGENSHHIIEGIFKALSRALAKASTIDERNSGKIPSTKGVI
ncbi:imidazoleglycerol-phosphate dehydratase [Eubacterium saphenum ATCC 49989]|nr:imidazoleglycerol-phosphate dehydratase [Eubacterium saphenum ATCC 49989]